VLWKFTGFCGHPDASKRKKAWSFLHLASLDPVPLACMGDFNEILHQSEKCRGNERHQGLMEDINSTLAICDLMDLGFRGPKFTCYKWSRWRRFYTKKKKLDRVVANEGWCAYFPKANILVEGATRSDQLPNVVTLMMK
jgi:hypothetical protein